MEILRRGKPKSERTYVGDCVQCGTQVRFTYPEAKWSNDQREPGPFVACPVCPGGGGTIWGKEER